MYPPYIIHACVCKCVCIQTALGRLELSMTTKSLIYLQRTEWNVWHGHIRSNNSLTLAITRVHTRNFIFLFTFCLRSMFCVPCCLYLWIVHFWFGCPFAFLYCLFNVSMTLSYSIKLAEISEHFLVRTRSWDIYLHGRDLGTFLSTDDILGHFLVRTRSWDISLHGRDLATFLSTDEILEHFLVRRDLGTFLCMDEILGHLLVRTRSWNISLHGRDLGTFLSTDEILEHFFAWTISWDIS
jgi:hypothetical protein